MSTMSAQANLLFKPFSSFRKTATAVPVNPDASLIALGKALSEADAELLEIVRQADSLTGEAQQEWCVAWDQKWDACAAIAEKIAGIKAHTMEGLVVKARAVAWLHSDTPPDDISGEGCTSDRIAFSIVSDLLRMTSN